MAERFVSLDKITPKTTNWKARLRVIKKYGEKLDVGSPTNYQKFIFGDEWGNRVDVIAFSENVDTFRDVLREGHSYVIKGAAVVEQKTFKNAITTSAYQWRLKTDTSIMEELTNIVPLCELKIDTITSNEFHLRTAKGSLINTACVIISRAKPKMGNGKDGQSRMIPEYAAVDTALESFVVTIWDKTIPDDVIAILDRDVAKPAVLLMNFGVVEYHGLSLSSNAQSIIELKPGVAAFDEIVRWKEEHDDKIEAIAYAGGLFQNKVLRSPKQPLKLTNIEQVLRCEEDKKFFNIKVHGRLDKDMQRFVYICYLRCNSHTSADFNTEFNCNKGCGGIQKAVRCVKFDVAVYDDTGAIDVTFFGTDAEKLIDLDCKQWIDKMEEDTPSHVNHIQEKLLDMTLLLRITYSSFLLSIPSTQ